MAKILMTYIVTIFLAVCCHCQSDNNPDVSTSWAKVKISPDTFSSMKYDNFRVEIYEHIDNKKPTTTASEKKYFYAPIALLDHTSAVVSYNRFTKQQEMRFRIEMWNDKVENEVLKYLNKIVGQEIQTDKVGVIPLEKVILTSEIPTEDYSLSPVWTNYDKSKVLWFSFSCYDRNVCNELADEMRSVPKHLDHFKLLYSLSSQTSQTKQATINIERVTSGQMVSTLLQKFGDKKEIFLTANDKKKMLTETATKIRIDTFDDSEVGSPDAEITIYSFLKDLLVMSTTTIKEQSDKMWDSVFWNEDNYRPDKTTKTLNKIINKLDPETQKILADMFQKAERQLELKETFTSSNKDGYKSENQTRRSQATDQEIFSRNQKWELAKNPSDEQNRNLENRERIQHNYDSNSWADVDRISSTISEKMANDSDSSSQFKILKEEVEKLLKESKDHVQWGGEKFVPKPIQLSRINLAKFRDSRSFQDRNIRVRYTTAELSAPIKIMEHTELTVTDEWNKMKDELKATTELLSTTVNDLAKTNTELSNVKSNLSNTRIDLTNITDKLGETKKELEKTKIDLEKTRVNVNNLSTKLNAAEKELAEMKIRTGNFSTELKGTKQELVKTRADVSKNVENLSAKLKEHELKVAEENLNCTVKEILYHLGITTNLSTTRTEFGKMPTSCSDLQKIGHKLNGFFLVKGPKKMETIYCNFYPNQNETQKWIGYADIKSTPVHFYAQRNSSFVETKTPISYELARVNEGNAMNLTSGIFTAPRPGIYFFSLMGLVRFSNSSSISWLGVGCYLNGNRIGASYVSELNTVEKSFSQLALQSTLNLKKGDRVWVQIDFWSLAVTFYDDQYQNTHFTGFALEEEIMASL